MTHFEWIQKRELFKTVLARNVKRAASGVLKQTVVFRIFKPGISLKQERLNYWNDHSPDLSALGIPFPIW